jgi:hypothetical protein
MPCVTHHHACECREAKFKEMCEYLLWASRNGTTHLSGFLQAIEAAAMIARELYPEVRREDHHSS